MPWHSGPSTATLHCPGPRPGELEQPPQQAKLWALVFEFIGHLSFHASSFAIFFHLRIWGEKSKRSFRTGLVSEFSNQVEKQVGSYRKHYST